MPGVKFDHGALVHDALQLAVQLPSDRDRAKLILKYVSEIYDFAGNLSEGKVADQGADIMRFPVVSSVSQPT